MMNPIRKIHNLRVQANPLKDTPFLFSPSRKSIFFLREARNIKFSSICIQQWLLWGRVVLRLFSLIRRGINHKLEMYRTLSIAKASDVFYIFCPSSALNIYDLIWCWSCESNSHQGTKISRRI